ncbi:PD40 domain-containing protein [candidate division KSB1 bacterium]|nr:PD40 domain-containing protein [candidate division KSB1 bacterium]
MFLVCIPLSGWGQLSYGRNHPELDWKILQTPHFQILFHQSLDSLAFEAAAIAEDHFTRISHDFKVPNMGKTDLILYDGDDIANGMANPLNHSILIYMAGTPKETADSLRWLDRVIGHEFGHMATFHAARNWLGKPWELLTLGLTPLWYLEGVAQWESETWDTHRNLFLGLNSRSNTLLPNNKLDGFLAADPIDGRLVYEEGHGLTRHIADRYGEEKVAEIIQSHRKNPIDFGWTLKRTVGKTGSQIFKEWKSELDQFYDEASVGRETISDLGQPLDIPLQVVMGVRYSPTGQIAAVGMERWDESVQRLYIQQSDLSWKQLGGPYVSGFFSWSKDGKRIIISRKHRGPHGSVVDDLFLMHVESGKEEALTDGARATDPAWSPVQEEAVFVRRYGGGSSLWMLDIPTGEMREIFQPEFGVEVFAPSWSPDGEWIAFSQFDTKGQRYVGIVRRDGSEFRKLTENSRKARTPTWSPDGERIAYCDYASGTPNLFRIRSDGSDPIPMTNAAGGLFNPTWMPDGSGIAAICFERRDSVKAAIIPSTKAVASIPKMRKPSWASAEPFPKHNLLDYKSSVYAVKTYRSLAQVRPHLVLPFIGLDDGGTQFGLIGYAADPITKHQFTGYLTARRRADFRMDYINTQFAPLINLNVWAQTFDRGDYFGAGFARLWERRSGWRLTFSWPINLGRTLLSNHVLRVWTGSERIQPIHPSHFHLFSPMFRPFAGWNHELGGSYGWAWQRPDVGVGIHPMTGVALSTGFSHSDAVWKSDIEQTHIWANTQYRQKLPWKRHVAAVRLACDLTEGDMPIQDLTQMGKSMIRGLTESREGDRFLHASAEYRLPLIRDIRLKIPFLYFERMTLAFWSDIGVVWGRTLETYVNGNRLAFQNTDPVITAGPELRLRLFLAGKLPIVVRGGYAEGMFGQTGGAWYFRIGNIF